MSDDLNRAFEELDPEDRPGDEPEPRVVVEQETLGVAWGFVAFLVFAALITVFIFQNNEQVQVSFLWLDVEMSLGLVVTVAILLTLVFDQLVSWLYRRRKRRQQRRARAADDRRMESP